MIRHYLIDGPWVVFLTYWAVSALKTRRTVHRESFVPRYGILLIEVTGFVLLFSDTANIGVLEHHIFPRNYAFSILAVALTWIGIALALWARSHLGQYWSGRITLKEGHQLIRTGPYAYFRHPIYSGLDLAAIGTALAVDRWRAVAGVAVIVVGYWIKASREESILSQQFGPLFQEHRQHTGFLLPKF
jgi:protein-S-isoprenylcysteine O-methyltransferase Ste14